MPTSMRFVRAAGAVLCLAFLPLAGCRGDHPADEAAAGQTAPGERHFLPGVWEVLWTVGGSERDTALLRPRKLVPGIGNDLYLVDDGRSA
ncbi:MAG TPA: hypothetical protein VFQ39_01245, partial [Longimicrobium sp.]|nr:hypothetical protein [Longimicrobium sp.]